MSQIGNRFRVMEMRACHEKIFLRCIRVPCGSDDGSLALGQTDRPGAKDYPGISRMPGYCIDQYSESQFDSFSFHATEAGKEKTQAVEGRLYKFRYAAQRDPHFCPMENLMRIGSLTLFLAIFAAFLTLAAAEEKYGVTVYDGAKYDADTSQFLASAMKVDAACYRTGATAAQVNEFYRKQPGTTEIHTSPKGGMFKKGSVSITVQSPWMDMKTHQEMKDTLISIVKNP
jgi:hypothetical protein